VGSVKQWLLVETFGPSGAEPRVIGVGTTPKNLLPLRTVIRSEASLRAVDAAIARVRATGEELDVSDGGRRVIARPLHTFAGNLHGVYVWQDAADAPVPPRPPAGAWQFNLTTDKIAGSDDLLDLYGVAPAERRSQRNTAEAFGRLITNADESAALAKIVQAEPGAEHRATWTVRRDDGQLRAAHFTCRAVAEAGAGGREVVLRGITQDVGPAATTPSAPPPIILAQQVLAGLAEPGTSRALVNLRTLRVMRWVDDDDPAPGIAWRHDPDDDVDHWLHPDDMAAARAMVDELVHGKVSGKLRFRTTDRDWRTLSVTANLVLLDSSTTAALFTLRDL
jgi:Domain of unknown function (DUF5593)